jgi:hypothetical protein
MGPDQPPTAVTQVEAEVRPPVSRGPLTLGTLIGRYVVLRPVGEGGMGMVYAGYDPDLDRQVALKVLREDLLGDAAHDLLLAEAQSLAKLRHANVVAVHDVGATGDGRVFMALDLIDGTDVLSWSRAGPRSWRDIVHVFLEAGRGLAAAHAAKLVHRDVKPANVLIDRDGHVFVADFGIARRADDPPTRPAGTPGPDGGTDVRPLAGTRPYMAPEVVAGTRASFLSDQYSFGASLHEVLFGRRPGDAAGPDPDRRVPAHVRRAIARMTASDPADRFPDVDAALAALAADPGRRLRIGAVVLVGAALVAVPVGFATRTAGKAPSPCEGGPDPLAGAWDDGRRGEVVRALSDARITAADLDGVTGQLDRYAARWRTSHREACLATRVRGEQSEQILSARMTCLDGRRAGLRGLTDALTKVSAEDVDRVPRAVSRLPEVDLCDDVLLVSQRVALPESAEQRAEIEVVRAELAALGATYDLGHTSAKDLRAPATRLAQRARAIGYAPLLAEALRLQGSGQSVAESIATGFELLEVSLAARDFEMPVQSAGTLIMDLCNGSRYGEARLVKAVARGAYAAAGRPPGLERDLMRLEVMLGMCESRPHDVIRAGSRAYELQVDSTDPWERWTSASMANNVGQSYVYLEDPEQAMVWIDRAAAAAARFAKVNTTVVQMRLGEVWAALALGDRQRVATALERSEQAIAKLGLDVGDMPCSLGFLRGGAALAEDDRARAEAVLAEATACAERTGATESVEAWRGLLRRAELVLAAGRLDDALAMARKGTEIVARDPNDHMVVLFRALAARILARTGKLDEATRELELAAPHLSADGPREERWAMTQVARAEIALARGDAAAALELARGARAARARRNHAFHVAEIDALIARAGKPR